MYDVTAIGELLIDFTSTGTDANGVLCYARHPGGAPANVLAANQKLGGKTAFIGKVGADSFGDFLEKTLRDIGVETQGLIRSADVHTTLAFVQLDEKGDRSFTFYRNPGADTMLKPDEVNESLILGSRMLHFGSVSLSREPARSATLHAIRTAKNAGKIISYDPNDRPLLWEDTDQARRIMREYAAFADIIKVSEEELYLLTGEADPIKGAALLARLGPALVLISMGPKGAFYYMEGVYGAVPTYDVKTIDTNGAGDAFLGAVHARLRNKSLDEIRGMSRADLENIVAFANAAGALTTTKNGAISAMPTLLEVEECMSRCPLLL
jgi:fructokinase